MRLRAAVVGFVGLVSCSSSSPLSAAGGSCTTDSNCEAGLACIGMTCCEAPCGSVCCSSGSVCVKDMAGNQTCATVCTDSTACPSASPCCATLSDSNSACLANGLVTGQTCSCPAGRTYCGSACCPAGQTCYEDSAGNPACVPTCTDSSSCPTASPCCSPLSNGQSVCIANGLVAGQECRCSTGSECSSGCCAPAIDKNGSPVGPYVCKANDGQPYDCCNGSVSCSGGSNNCCVSDAQGNEFCAEPCTNDSNCGAAHCDSLTPAALSSCSGSNFCGE